MRLNLRILVLIVALNLNQTSQGSTIEQNTGFDFSPIKTELAEIFYYTQNMTTILPQLVLFLPELQIIISQIPNYTREKQLSAYIATTLSLVMYLYYTTSGDTAKAKFLALIANDISYILPNTQSIVLLVPQIYTALQQLALVDSNINVTSSSSLQDQLVYISMVFGFLTYFAYIEKPY